MCMASRCTFSASDNSVSLSASRTLHGISAFPAKRPSFASRRNAARRRDPATTSYLPFLPLRTVRLWISPCASMLSASSDMPTAALTRRTFAALGTSRLRAMASTACWMATVGSATVTAMTASCALVMMFMIMSFVLVSWIGQGNRTPSCFPGPREWWGWRGTTGIRGEPAARNAEEEAGRKTCLGKRRGNAPRPPQKNR